MKSKMNHKPKAGMPAKVTKQPGKGGGAMQSGKMGAVKSTTRNGKY